MKDSVLRVIEAWQQNPNRTRGLCLRNPTCSVYGHRAISRYGLIRGGIMTAWRVFTCNGCMRQRHRWPGDAYRSDVPTLSGTRSP